MIIYDIYVFADPEINSRQLGGSPRPVLKGSDHYRPHDSVKRARAESLKRSQSIPAITTAQLEAAVAHSPTDSIESTDDGDNVALKEFEATESFKGHPVWKRRLSTSLPSGTWNDSVVTTETPKTESKKLRYSMFAVVADIEVTNFVNTHSNDFTDYEITTLLTNKSVSKEEETTLSLPSPLQDFSIPWEEVDMDFNTIVSDGAFSRSYKSKWMKAECLVTQYKSEIFSDTLLLAKCQQLAKLRHPNLLQLLGFTRESESSSFGLVITEKLSVTLDVMLKRRSPLELTVGPKVTIASDIAKALCYLHQQPLPLVHCAVVPANIHVTAYYSAKLSDTGFGEVAITSKAIAPSLSRYLPLEAISDVPTVSPSLDIFTFGVTVSEMVTHKEPDHRSSPANKESEKQRVTEIIGLIGEDHLLADLITQSLSVEPEDRPSAVKLYNLLQTVHISLLES